MRDAAPFKPFQISLADGHSHLVTTADHLFFIPNSSEFILVLPSGGFRIVDSTQVVSVGRNASRSKAH